MKERFLQQIYPYDPNLEIYQVVINLDDYRDVYSDWDYSPLVNRDLDDDLFDYLMGCSREIGLKRSMEVIFYIPGSIVDKSREAKSITGFSRYFSYRIRKVKGERGRVLRKSGILFSVGSLFLLAANTLQHQVGLNFTGELVSEGLFIGAWVAIWEIFSVFFFDIQELNWKIRHFERLREIPVRYQIKSMQSEKVY